MNELMAADARIQSLELLAERESAVHSLHPLTKLLMTLVYLVAVVSCPQYSPERLFPLLLYPAVMMAASETPYKPLLKRLLIALPFSLFGGGSNLIFDRATAFLLVGIPVSYGAISFVTIMLKTFLSVLAVLALVATTRMDELFAQLARMKLPAMFVTVLMLTYRYLSVLLEEAGRMYISYSVRSPGKKGIRMHDMGFFLGTLLLRSIDRAERVYASMLCRGYRADACAEAAHSYPIKELCLLIPVAAITISLRIFDVTALLSRIFS